MPLHLMHNSTADRHRPIRAKLIFNPESGSPGDSPDQLVRILAAMQEQNILPEVHLVRPDIPLEKVVRDSIRSGIRLIVVAGGDGTIDRVAGTIVGSHATLGVIPTGTRNNVAFNLGIAADIAGAVDCLRNGHPMKIDVGRVHSGRARGWFLEAAAMGLLSDLYPLADDFQHGDLAQIGGILNTLVASAPSRLRLHLDGRKRLTMTAHMMVIANMSFLGPHFQISPNVSFRDGQLDVFTFSDMSKLNMISYALLSQGGLIEDSGIRHYRTRHIKIRSEPPMPVLADGSLLGQGSLSIHVYPRALKVMAGKALSGQAATSAVADPRLSSDD